MNYDESDIDPQSVPEPLEQSAEAESETVTRDEYYGHHTTGGAPAGERRAATQLWLISYADFMTILLIFFLVMYGYTYLARATLLSRRSAVNRFSTFTNMVYGLKQDVGQNNMEIIEGLEKVTIQLKDQVLFPSGSDKVSPSAERTLDELAQSLKLVEGPVIVEGHTDNVPIVGGRFRSNWELSAARAFSVIDALTKKGVPPGGLSAWGFGEFRPVASNEDLEGKARNRRIEIVVFKK
jgi:flagellar motor protein MotB